MASSSKKPSSAKKTAPSEVQTLAVYFSNGSFLTLSDDNKQWIDDKVTPCMVRYRGCSIAIAHLPVVNAIIVAGGSYSKNPLSSAEMFDLTTKTWTEQPPMSTKRILTAGICLADGSTFLVCGGKFGDETHSSCEQFNSVTRTWSSVGNMSTPRERHSIVLYRGVPVVLGGVSARTLTTCEQYGSDTWSSFPSFKTPRCLFGAAVVLDKIYITGGFDAREVDSSQYDSIEVYDGTMWSGLSSTLSSGSRYGHAAACFQDKLVVVGGTKHDVDAYDPIADTWSNTYYPQFEIFLFCQAQVIAL